jgi:hypothetical protein
VAVGGNDLYQDSSLDKKVRSQWMAICSSFFVCRVLLLRCSRGDVDRNTGARQTMAEFRVLKSTSLILATVPVRLQ